MKSKTKKSKAEDRLKYKVRHTMVLSPLDIMKLLNAIFPLTKEEKAKYKEEWRRLPFSIRMQYNIGSIKSRFENRFCCKNPLKIPVSSADDYIVVYEGGYTSKEINHNI